MGQSWGKTELGSLLRNGSVKKTLNMYHNLRTIESIFGKKTLNIHVPSTCHTSCYSFFPEIKCLLNGNCPTPPIASASLRAYNIPKPYTQLYRFTLDFHTRVYTHMLPCMYVPLYNSDAHTNMCRQGFTCVYKDVYTCAYTCLCLWRKCL